MIAACRAGEGTAKPIRDLARKGVPEKGEAGMAGFVMSVREEKVAIDGDDGSCVLNLFRMGEATAGIDVERTRSGAVLEDIDAFSASIGS